jgi:NitT/TauT family transport system permease protein
MEDTTAAPTASVSRRKSNPVLNDNEAVDERSRSRAEKIGPARIAPPLLVLTAACGAWWLLSRFVFPEHVFPSPPSVVKAFREEIVSGDIFVDTGTSLFRVLTGFGLAAVLGIPLGIALGHSRLARESFVPAINFFRNLSPLSWIPFAILWFGIGHLPAIFLIFMAAFFPLMLSVMAAVGSVPQVYFRVASDYQFSGVERLWRVTLPAIMPSLITGLRVACGVSWVVLVAAEMIAGRSGLGFLIWDARNGLRTDLLVVGMISIGLVGVVMDALLVRLTKLPSVRWGYER